MAFGLFIPRHICIMHQPPPEALSAFLHQGPDNLL